MVEVEYPDNFEKIWRKIDFSLQIRVKKQIEKIIENPEIGKPMMHSRKGTREVYIPPFRLSYTYVKEEDKIIFLDLYHKDEQ
ncbi:MAG: type II toxin-antitoxin system RelE/ParE family toxin [Nanoarchaeota archaeon]